MTTAEKREIFENRMVATFMQDVEGNSKNLAVAEKHAKLMVQGLTDDEIETTYSDLDAPKTLSMPANYSQELISFIMLITLNFFKGFMKGGGLTQSEADSKMTEYLFELAGKPEVDERSARIYRAIATMSFHEIQNLYIKRGIFGKI